jgi:hypothetical protein
MEAALRLLAWAAVLGLGAVTAALVVGVLFGSG